MSVHYSSKTTEWSTPQLLFETLDAIFHFDIDVCATAANAKCRRYFTKEDDALKQKWHGTVWMNPPYGRQIQHFIKKAYEASLEGATVVCLVPARTDTRWWHEYIKGGTIIFLPGRLCFSGSKNRAPFPSAIVVFWNSFLLGGC